MSCSPGGRPASRGTPPRRCPGAEEGGAWLALAESCAQEVPEALLRRVPERGFAYPAVSQLQGKAIKTREHQSGFPAVTVDTEGIHILTDIISLEQWWSKKQGKG